MFFAKGQHLVTKKLAEIVIWENANRIVRWCSHAKVYRKKAPKKGKQKETKGQGLKSRLTNNPTKVGHKEEREPLRTEPSTNHMKQIN